MVVSAPVSFLPEALRSYSLSETQCYYFCLAALGLCRHAGFSPAVVHGHPTEGLPLLQSGGSRRAGFSSCSPWPPEPRAGAAVHVLSCPAVCEVFLDEGLSPRLLRWQADSSPLGLQGSPCCLFQFCSASSMMSASTSEIRLFHCSPSFKLHPTETLVGSLSACPLIM